MNLDDLCVCVCVCTRVQAVPSLITPFLHPQHLAANWKYIQSSKRTIIHIPSLGSFLAAHTHLIQQQSSPVSPLCCSSLWPWWRHSVSFK